MVRAGGDVVGLSVCLAARLSVPVLYWEVGAVLGGWPLPGLHGEGRGGRKQGQKPRGGHNYSHVVPPF